MILLTLLLLMFRKVHPGSLSAPVHLPGSRSLAIIIFLILGPIFLLLPKSGLHLLAEDALLLVLLDLKRQVVVMALHVLLLQITVIFFLLNAHLVFLPLPSLASFRPGHARRRGGGGHGSGGGRPVNALGPPEDDACIRLFDSCSDNRRTTQSTRQEIRYGSRYYYYLSLATPCWCCPPPSGRARPLRPRRDCWAG